MIDVEKQICEVMELVQYLMNAQSSSQRIREKKSLESKLRTLLSIAQSGEQAPKFFFNPRDAERYHDGQSRFDCGSLPVSRKPDRYYTDPLYTHPAPSLEVELDAKRWKMVELICREVMLSPDKRTEDAAVSAYVNAVGSGLDYQAAVDAAIAASQPNGEAV